MKRTVKISKFLSLVLRHRPERIGLELDAQGWAEVDALLTKAAAAGMVLDRESLLQVVADNDKQRFIISADGQRIRANQGHSIEIDLGLSSVPPPELLYHGTAARFLDSILAQGLRPGRRQHVHLSADIDTAVKVGRRHGKPVVLHIDAAAMAAQGFDFFVSANGVWLTAAVPVAFIQVPQ